MKTLKIKIPDRLYTLETGPEAQVGDQVKMFLDQAAIPDLPEFLFGVIQHPIKRVGACEDSTLYTIEYTLADYTLRDDDVLEIVTTSAVDVVANDLLEEEVARAAADVVLQSNIDAEAATRAAADTTLQTNITAEETARIAADGVLQTNIDNEESARIAADIAVQAASIQRANHTGTQTLATISDAGTAAAADTGDFATAAQGALADSAVQPVGAGDIEVTDSTKGIILTSPDLTRWRIQVNNTGNLITTSL